MTAKTDIFENRLSDFIWRGKTLVIGGATAAWSPAAPTFYLGLFTVAPGEAGGGTEVTGGGYARQAVAASDANFTTTQGTSGAGTTSSGTDGTIENAAVVPFGTASADLGNVQAFGWFDSLTGGTLLEYANLTPARTITNGTTYSFSAGALTIQEDN